MKKTVWRISAAAAALLCIAAVSACGDSTAAPAETAGTAGESEAVSETEDSRYAVTEDVPDSDFGGYEFKIQTRDADHHTKELVADSENGETINDAVYRRNAAVEEKLNIKITAVLEDESDESYPPKCVRTAVQAGDSTYCDVALVHTIQAGTLAADGVLYNWYDVPYVDFTKPYWNQSYVEELTIGDALYLVNGDLCLSAIDYTWSMVYNKELASNYDIGDIYAMVDNGTWTKDAFMEMALMCTADLNGDGKYDDNDLYGFVTHDNSAIVNWMFALGQKVTEMDSDHLPVLALNTERMVNIVNWVYDLLKTGNQAYVVTDTYTEAHNTTHDLAVANMFAQGQTLFAALRIYVIDELRSMNTDFGIIPFPKYDESQEGYYTHVDGHAPLICLPKTQENPERTGIVMECLNAESHRTCLPAEYDVVLSEKYARDETSVRMLDIILDGRTANFGYVYEGSTNMQWSLTLLMKSDSNDFASYYKKHEKAALKYYNKIIEAHEELE